jgi:hypothetical protein
MKSITASNGDKTINTTLKMFDAVYQAQGYVIVDVDALLST